MPVAVQMTAAWKISYGGSANSGAATAHVVFGAPSWICLGSRPRRRSIATLLLYLPTEPLSRNEPSFLCSSGNLVRKGDSDFESLGFINAYQADYISVQCVEPLPEKVRYDYLAKLKEEEDLGTAINQAMRLIEDEVPEPEEQEFLQLPGSGF